MQHPPITINNSLAEAVLMGFCQVDWQRVKLQLFAVGRQQAAVGRRGLMGKLKLNQ